MSGHGYFTKLNAFYEKYCEFGDLYIEFRKCQTEEESCDSCQRYPPLVGLKPIPRPYPDYDALPRFKYKDHANIPILKDDGNLREVDDENTCV